MLEKWHKLAEQKGLNFQVKWKAFQRKICQSLRHDGMAGAIFWCIVIHSLDIHHLIIIWSTMFIWLWLSYGFREDFTQFPPMSINSLNCFLRVTRLQAKIAPSTGKQRSLASCLSWVMWFERLKFCTQDSLQTMLLSVDCHFEWLLTTWFWGTSHK